MPLGPHPHCLTALFEPDEAARGPESAAGLGDRDPGDVVEVVDGADPARDLGDEPLPRECLVEHRGRARPLECKRGLAGECLHQLQLFV